MLPPSVLTFSMGGQPAWRRGRRKVLLPLLVARAVGGDSGSRGFSLGEPLQLECRNFTSGGWEPGPLCEETAEPLMFEFGIDSFWSCGVRVDAELYHALREIVLFERHWACRLPISAPSDGARARAFLPVTVALWGVVEEAHVHVGNRMNAVFHVEDGKLAAASLYPHKDKFQFIKQGSVLHLHGPVQWWQVAAFAAQLGSSSGAAAARLWPLALLWSVCTAVLTALAGVALYHFRVRPELVKSFSKSE